MSLDEATIARLVALKAQKAAPASKKASTGGGNKRSRFNRLVVRQTQYPELVPNDLVKHISKSASKPCTSYGCGSPSYYTFSGSSLCNIHLIYALVHELNRGEKTSGESQPTNQAADIAYPPLEDSPLVTAATVSSNRSDEDDDDNSYL